MPPEYLYKYMPVKAKDGDKTERESRQRRYDACLTQNRLYFSHPEDFNDPMDSRPHFAFSGTAEQLKILRGNLLWKAAMRTNPNPQGKSEFLQKVAQYLDESPEVGADGFDDFVQSQMTEHVRDVGILCLSETGSCPVMFYHYADAHTGICMRFRTTSDYFAMAEKVNYCTDYPEIDYFADDDGSEFETIFLKKYKSWDYEREWRVVDFNNKFSDKASRLVEYEPQLLDAVIFGYLMEDEEKRRITSLLRSANRTANLLQAKLKPRSFELEVVPWQEVGI